MEFGSLDGSYDDKQNIFTLCIHVSNIFATSQQLNDGCFLGTVTWQGIRGNTIGTLGSTNFD